MADSSDIRRFVDAQLRLLTKSTAKALTTGGAEAVHDLRVASRRLEEPLELCRVVCEGKGVDRALKQLKRIRRAFRYVRELDVLAESFEGIHGEPSEADVSQLLEAVTVRREREYRKAVAKVEPSQLEAVDRAVDELVEQAQGAEGVPAEWAAAGVCRQVNERIDAVLARDSVEGQARDLHMTRVALKRLRYSVELRMALMGGVDRAVLERFKAAQDRLGDWNDHLGAARTVTAIARKRAVLLERPTWAAAVLGYAAERIRRSQAEAESFLAAWPELRERIGQLRVTEG